VELAFVSPRATARFEDPELERLRTVLAAHTPGRVSLPADLGTFRAAAVLVPVVPRGGQLHLLFTQRHADLRTHSGQISFPGGKVDDSDLDAAHTALREADEELGIERETVHVIGELGQVPTPTGYLITPVVGVILPAPARWRPSESEVAEAFEVPLATLRDPALVEDRGEVTRWGYTWRTCAYKPDGRNIWGATARMVHELLALWG